MTIRSSNIKIRIIYTNYYRRFLEVGHTQCDGDSMHARIESHSKNKSVWTQEQWCEIMEDSKIENKYTVNAMGQTDILDFHDLAENFKWTSVRISHVREITVEPDQKHVYVKYEWKENPLKVDVYKKNVTLKSIRDYQLQQAYSGKFVLNDKKKKDLISMVTKKLVPEEFKGFYEDIVGEKIVLPQNA